MSIQQHALECAKLFSSLENLGLEDKDLVADFEAQKSRFKVWPGNLGVFANGRASADYRLRDDTTASGLTTSQLTQLANKLRATPFWIPQKATDELAPEHDPECSESDSSVASLIIEEETDSEPGSEPGKAKQHNFLTTPNCANV